MLAAQSGLEDPVAHAHGLRRQLDQLFLVDPFERRVERHHPCGREPNRLVMTGGADIRELLLTADVDWKIRLARVLADDHPFINRFAGADEKSPALLQMENSVRARDAFTIRNHRTVLA